MSLVADKSRSVSSRRRTSRPLKRRVGTAGASAQVKPRAVAKPAPRARAKAKSGSGWLAVPFGFVIMASMSFVASSVAGNVLLEQARRDRINSVERVNAARLEVARLRIELNGLTSMAAVDSWAQANRMHLSGVEIPEYLNSPNQTAMVASLEEFKPESTLPDGAGVAEVPSETAPVVEQSPTELAPSLIATDGTNAENLPD